MGALLTAWKIKCIKIALFSMISHAISTNTKCWRKEVSVTVRLEISWDHIPLWLLIMLQQHQHLTITNKWQSLHFSVYEKLQICIWDVPAMDSMLSFLLPLAVLRSHNTSTAALRSFGRKHKRPLCWASGPYSQREYTKTRQQFISSFSCMLQKSSMWKDEFSSENLAGDMALSNILQSSHRVCRIWTVVLLWKHCFYFPKL